MLKTQRGKPATVASLNFMVEYLRCFLLHSSSMLLLFVMAHVRAREEAASTHTKTRTCEYVAQEQLKLRGLYIVGSWTRCPTYSGWDGGAASFGEAFFQCWLYSWRHSWLLRAKMRGFFFCGTEGGLGRTGILLLH
jgi:hypothetical protein